MPRGKQNKRGLVLAEATEQIDPAIVTARGHKVLLDADLAGIYGVTVASIGVVRAFVRLRQLVLSHEEFRARLQAIEKQLEDHDQQFAAVFEAIRALMDIDEQEAQRPRIGYQTEGLHRGKLLYTTMGPRQT